MKSTFIVPKKLFTAKELVLDEHDQYGELERTPENKIRGTIG